MSNTVFCRKYQTQLPAMARPPYPGPKGQELFANVSQRAWEEWLSHQTLLIKEKHLNMRDPASRTYLQGEMEKFLSGEDYDQAEGYVAPSK